MGKFLKPSFFLQLIIAITFFDNAEHFKKITTIRRTNTRDLVEKRLRVVKTQDFNAHVNR